MDSERLLYLIDIVFQEIDNVVSGSKQLKPEEEPVVSTVNTPYLYPQKAIFGVFLCWAK